MTNPLDDTIRSGAAHVDETERMASGLSAQRQNEQEDMEISTPETALANLTLSMFTPGILDSRSGRQRPQFVRVL